MAYNVAGVADRVVVTEFAAGVFLSNAPLVYGHGESVSGERGELAVCSGEGGMLLLTALGLGDAGNVNGELSCVLGGDQSQPREREDSGGRTHCGGDENAIWM